MPSATLRHESPGPFYADQLRDGDPYELSNGHAIRCMSSGESHALSNLDGGRVLATDPAAQATAVDLGLKFNQGKNLRAPDLAVGAFTGKPGFSEVVPGLVVEYAGVGQNEADLELKIAELLELGVRYLWVVRLVGPLRVEVYERGQAMRCVDGDGVLRADGVLQNPVPVRALVDADAANEATLRNLLNRKGYTSLDAAVAQGEAKGEAKGKAAGKAAGKAEALLAVLRARGVAIPAAARAQILGCPDADRLSRWIEKAVLASSLEDVLPD